jgi:hypothetical protein
VVFFWSWVLAWSMAAGLPGFVTVRAAADPPAASELAVAVASDTASAPVSLALPDAADRVRIAEAWRIADRLGDDLWPGFSEAPRAVLLVTSKTEYLFYHPSPTPEFVPLGFDSITSSLVFARSRVFDKRLLATYPAVAGVPTVVIGEPRNTEASHSTRWVATLLHEHFHQYQQSQPGYYEDALALGLAGDDSTGMWMLDYPFPYDSRRVGEAFASLCRLLVDAVGAIGRSSFRSKLDAYLEARSEFALMLGEKDYKYFSFQVWQEGIARYTEYELIRRASVAYTPSVAFMLLPDRISFAEDASQTRSHVLTELRRMSLKKARRTAFYHIGAAEGMLLDEVGPGWRGRYPGKKFFIEKVFRIG